MGSLTWSDAHVEPSLLILGWQAPDGRYTVVASARLAEASMDVTYHTEMDELAPTGAVVSSGTTGHVSFRAQTEPFGEGGDPVYMFVMGDTYAEAIRRLAVLGEMKELQDSVTHAKVADVVADALEVSNDDDIVQRIAAAIMEAGIA